MIIAGTGHRPEKAESEHIVREKVRLALRDSEATYFVCGLASGFDLWAGTTALRMGMQVIAARPWAGHTPRIGDRELYAEVVESASRIVNIVEQEDFPGNWCYQKRNEWMVDHSDRVLAYWNGEASGTGNCVMYARKVGKPVRNIYA